MLPLKSPRVCPEPALRLAAAVEGKAEFARPAPRSPLAGAARDEQRLRVLLVRTMPVAGGRNSCCDPWRVKGLSTPTTRNSCQSG
jgi:hypothetical protein